MKQDSIGTEENNGQKYILHKVGDNETLYSVSRRYDVPIHKIIEHNPPVEFGLDQGQIIKVPYAVQLTNAPRIPEPGNLNKVVGQQDKVQESIKDVPEDRPLPPRPLRHTVAAKETLFSISRMYNAGVEDIKKWNGLTSNDLSIGQELVLFRSKPIEPSAPEEKGSKKSDITHIVEASETLYSISKKYEVSLSDLKEWNDLIGNEISIGQELIVSKKTPEQEVVRGEDNDDRYIREIVKSTPKDTLQQKVVLIDTARYNIKPRAGTNFEEIEETGLAEQIEGTSGNRKYLALHRSAKTGTIMRVKNEMNDQEVFVRVVGKLPDTSNNNNVVLKISKAAYDKLGAIDPKFRVKVTYIP